MVVIKKKFPKFFFQKIFDLSVNVLEAFYLTLVEKNCQNKGRRKRRAIGKSQAVIGWKRISERASFMYNL